MQMRDRGSFQQFYLKVTSCKCYLDVRPATSWTSVASFRGDVCPRVFNFKYKLIARFNAPIPANWIVPTVGERNLGPNKRLRGAWER